MGETIGRTFIFEKELWAQLDADAKRCLRSSTKQLEAILKTYFGASDVGLNEAGLEMLGELAPHSARKTPLIEAADKKKKRA
jgi:hypothetical protein